MKIGLRELPNLVSAYQFLEQVTSLGHEPLEFSPMPSGVRVLVKLRDLQSCDCQVFDLSESILKAYLGLDPGHMHNHIGIIEFSFLSDAFAIAVDAESKGIKVHDVRFLKGAALGHHIILSHSEKIILQSLVQKKQGFMFSTENKKMLEFLGFSNVAVNGEL